MYSGTPGISIESIYSFIHLSIHTHTHTHTHSLRVYVHQPHAHRVEIEVVGMHIPCYNSIAWYIYRVTIQVLRIYTLVACTTRTNSRFQYTYRVLKFKFCVYIGCYNSSSGYTYTTLQLKFWVYCECRTTYNTTRLLKFCLTCQSLQHFGTS